MFQHRVDTSATARRREIRERQADPPGLASRRSPLRLLHLVRACPALSAIVLLGCGQVFRAPALAPPSPQPLAAVYPDAAGGRVAIVADFEQPERAGFFRTEPASGRTWCAPSRLRARRTGSIALRVHLEAASDQLIATNLPAGRGPGFVRDWTPYNLLIMSVYSPRPVLALAFEVRSGGEDAEVFRRDDFVLTQGWNVLRVDLGEVGGHVDLRDVRQLRWMVPQLAGPIDLYLDDLILVDNRRDLLGSPQGRPGTLYVQSVGRRLRIGAVGRFELVFARGRIVHWFGLQADPQRRLDLAGSPALGPMPVLLDEQAGGPIVLDRSQWSPLGQYVTTRQAVREAAPQRVVVLAEWRFGDCLAPAPSGPAIRWIYTIYPDGRMFVRLECPTQAGQWQASAAGCVVACDGRAGFQQACRGSSRQETPSALPAGAYALHYRPRSRLADALFVLHPTGQTADARPLACPQASDVCSLLLSRPTEHPVQRWAMMIMLWPSDLDSPELVCPLAMDYCLPAAIRLSAGKLVRTDEGDLNKDGFNESQGCYVIEPDDAGRLRFVFDPGDRVRFSPRFKLLGTAGRQVWIYCDDKLIRQAWRDGEGRIMFELPGPIDAPRRIEAFCRSSSGKSPGGHPGRSVAAEAS